VGERRAVVERPGSTQEIAAQVRSALETRDLTALEPLLADDAQWGSCVGRAQVVEWMQDATSSGLVVEVADAIAHPDRVVLQLRVRNPDDDDVAELYQVLLIRDAKITEVLDAADRDQALVVTPTPVPVRPSGPGARLDSTATIFAVRDLDRALDHYRRLGFEVREYDGGGYGFAHRDGADLHFSEISDLDRTKTTSAVYLYVDDADALFAEWRSSGVTGQFFEPVDTDYGLREGAHVDRDGNLLRFGSRPSI
jgi:hypothetical protein